MKVIVCGGRDFIDYRQLKNALNRHLGNSTPTIIQGGAKGADFLAKVWAFEYEAECIEVKADWQKYKKAAGHIRNKEMLGLNPDLVIAFPGGNGTNNMVDIAKNAGVKVIDYREANNE